MPKLPDFSTLGQPVAPANSDNEARIQMRSVEGTTASARALPRLAGQEGQGLEAAGRAITRIGNASGEVQQRQDELNSALADASWTASRSNIGYAAEKEQDPAALRTDYHKQYETAFDAASAQLSGPQKELWTARHAGTLAAARVNANQLADGLDKGKFLGDAQDSFQNYRTAFLRTGDPAEHARIRAEVGNLADGLVANGYREPAWAAKFKNDFTEGTAEEWLKGRPPDVRLSFARPIQTSGNVAKAYDLFAKEGFSPAQASGAVGGLIGESGKGLDPNTVNPGDGADGSDSIGVGQWNGDRAVALKRFATAQGKPWNDLDTQLRFAVSELNGTEKAAGDRLKAAGTVEEAAQAWLGYERPRGFEGGLATASGGEGRLRAAQTVFARLHGNEPAPDIRLAAAIPPDKLKQIGEGAERDLERQSSAQKLLFRNEQASVKSLSADDIQQIISTGQEMPQISPQRVELALGPNERAVFEQERTNAHDYYTAMRDIASIPDEALDARAARLDPAPNLPGRALRQGYADTARKQIADLRKLREDDPARSVAEFPAVAEITGASLDKPTTFQPLASARVAAQEQVGIPEELRVPITAAEARRLWAVVTVAPETEKSAALQFVTRTLKDATGDYAENALSFILRQAHAGQETAAQASFFLRKVGQGIPTTQRDATAVNEAATRDAGQAATGQVLPPEAAYLTRIGAPAPAPTRPIYPLPPDEAIKTLKTRPATASKFDARFGPGASRRILEGPSG